MASKSKVRARMVSPKLRLAGARLDNPILAALPICARQAGPPCGFGIEPMKGDPSMSRRHDHAGVIAPPPLIFATAFFAGYALDRLVGWPRPHGVMGLQLSLAIFLALVGAGLGIAAVWEFRRARTNVLPERPTTALAEGGVYRFTRNPMYLGLACQYAALAVDLDHPVILALLPPALLVIHFGVVRREERYLTAKFGVAYLNYRARTPRWI
jgi:protein-S-isoprenylcysteine O-methyltransferase Ste14